MAFSDFENRWRVVLVLQTNMAEVGGTLTIQGPEQNIRFQAAGMGPNTQDWNKVTDAVYNINTNEITGTVTDGNNPFVMGLAPSGGEYSLMSCLVGVTQNAALTGQTSGEAGSWTSTDGPGGPAERGDDDDQGEDD
jgi:hypothetical protein